MKGILISVLFLLIHVFAYSQRSVTGIVKAGDGQPVPFVLLSLVAKSDHVKVKQAMSDTTGAFTFAEVMSGDYSIVASNILYDTVVTDVHVENTDVRGIKVLLLKERSTKLKGVDVVSRKEQVTQKIDRLVVNVKGTQIGISGSALEVLQRLPGVEISSDGTGISLNGKYTVGIMMNNKLVRVPISALLQMLSSTNAKEIERIELISNPPAQYDAEFTGGLINIVQSKNNDDGANIGLLLGAGYGWRDKEKAGGNWNIRKSKVNFFGDLNYDRNNNPRKFNYHSFNSDSNGTYSNYTYTNRYPVITGYTGRAGLDYALSKKATLGILLNGNLNYFKQHVYGASRSQNDDVYTGIDILNNEDSRRSLLVANANLSIRIDSNSTLNVDLDHLNFLSKAPNYYSYNYNISNGVKDSLDIVAMSKKTPVNVWAGKIDYSWNTGRTVTLNMGSKITHSILKNTVEAEHLKAGVLVNYDEFSSVSDLNENIYALYASLDWKQSKNTRINLGLRYEYSNQRLNIQGQGAAVDKSLSELFPIMFFSSQVSKKILLQFSYGRRIQRPTYNDLAPYVSFLDPNTYYIGNIHLKPSFSNNISAAFRFLQYLVSLEMSDEKNAIAQSQALFVADSRQQKITALNLDKLLTTSLSFNIPIKVTDWWNMTNNLRLLYQHQQLVQEKSTDWFYVLKTTQDFRLSKDLSAQVFVSYNSSRIYGNSTINGFQRTSCSISRNIKKWNSSVQLSINDIFGRYYSFQSANSLNRYYRENDEFETRVVRFTYTYNFGNINLSKERKRETSSDDIRGRL